MEHRGAGPLRRVEKEHLVEKLGRYTLIEITSREGTVETWQAHDEVLDRAVLLRIPPRDADEATRTGFEEATRLRSPAPLHVDRAPDGRPYAVFAPPVDADRTAVMQPPVRRLPRWAWVVAAVLVAAAAAALLVTYSRETRRPSVAVLPMTVTRISPENDWIPIAYEYEVNNNLVQIRRVRALDLGRLTDDDLALPPAALARAIKADYLMTGTLGETAGKVTLSLTVISSSGEHLLQSTREHDVAADPVTVIRDLAAFAAGAIEMAASPRADSAFVDLTADSRAWALFLRGDYEGAARIDPHFVMALREVYVTFANKLHEDPSHYAEWKRKMDEAYARYRSELDSSPLDRLWKGRFLTGDALTFGRFQEAYDEGMKVYRMDASAPDIRYLLFDACLALGKFSQARRMATEDLAQPGARPIQWENYGATLVMDRRYDRAAEAMHTALEKWPDSWNLHNMLAMAEILAGHPDRATADVTELESADGVPQRGYRAWIAAAMGARTEAMAMVESLAASVDATEAEFDLPSVCALLVVGEKDRALRILSRDDLNRGIREWSTVLAPFDSLRGDPRFTALQRQWGVYSGTPPGYRKG
jgi:tetratricopeptide (TPR) repeat protein